MPAIITSFHHWPGMWRQSSLTEPWSHVSVKQAKSGFLSLTKLLTSSNLGARDMELVNKTLGPKTSLLFAFSPGILTRLIGLRKRIFNVSLSQFSMQIWLPSVGIFKFLLSSRRLTASTATAVKWLENSQCTKFKMSGLVDENRPSRISETREKSRLVTFSLTGWPCLSEDTKLCSWQIRCCLDDQRVVGDVENIQTCSSKLQVSHSPGRRQNIPANSEKQRVCKRAD